MSSVIDQLIDDAVADGAVPHVAVIAADADGIVYEGAAGPRAVGSPEPVDTGTRFRIMSMTKPLVTTAALQLVERGELDLDAPVQDYLPEFADLQVLVGFDGDTPKLRPPARRATVKHLLTHTSGLGYWFLSEDLVRWLAATGTPSVATGLKAALNTPLLAEPGTRLTYGISTDWLGLVVEVAGGRSLDVAIAEGIAAPLGMHATAFRFGDEQPANLAMVHVRGRDGGWVCLGETLPQEPEWRSGGHGLYSTPRDYIRFQRALLRGGELDGERILRPRTVAAAFANQIGDLDFPASLPSADRERSCDLTVGPGHKWGYGLLLNTADRPGMRRAGSGEWRGLCNTYFWIDPAEGICAAIYTNYFPFLDPGALELYAGVERAVYASR